MSNTNKRAVSRALFEDDDDLGNADGFHALEPFESVHKRVRQALDFDQPHLDVASPVLKRQKELYDMEAARLRKKEETSQMRTLQLQVETLQKENECLEKTLHRVEQDRQNLAKIVRKISSIIPVDLQY